MDLKSKIAIYPDFPKPGISFKDINSLIKDGEAFHEVTDQFYEGFGCECRLHSGSARLYFRLSFGVQIRRWFGADPQTGETARRSYGKVLQTGIR